MKWFVSSGRGRKKTRLGISVDEKSASAEELRTRTHDCGWDALNVHGLCASLQITGRLFGAALPEPGRLK